MVRPLLLTFGRPRAEALAALIGMVLLAGCSVGAQEGATRDEAHGDLACATCHRGDLADRGEASVPRAACVDSGCHEGGGPARVELATVAFDHRSHAAGSEIALGCSGCHGHTSGSDPLTASVDACALCHIGEISEGEGGECRTCHQDPGFTTRTSQGLEVPHEGLPWITGGCIRCHYDVSEAPHDVPIARCAACHVPVVEAASQGVGTNLHPSHAGIACTTCHDSELHRIQAVSSVVDLRCSDCHREIHGVETTGGWPSSTTCNDCHGSIHEEQQRLLLGILPGGLAAAPAEKFMAGLTCRSCHAAEPEGAATEAVQADADACVGCHRPEYATVLRWWRQGTDDRRRRVEAYVSRTERDLASPSDEARGAVEEARALLDLVAVGGGEHNVALSHQVLEAALDRATDARRAAGQNPPAPPDLGRQPTMGLCSYCHYRLDDPWQFQSMPADFHREVLQPRDR